MFIQVIQGRAINPDGIRAAADRWNAELQPGAEGWLGSTSGVTDDGRFIAVVRFQSEELARRNSDRPEQGDWWNQMARTWPRSPSTTRRGCTPTRRAARTRPGSCR